MARLPLPPPAMAAGPAAARRRSPATATRLAVASQAWPLTWSPRTCRAMEPASDIPATTDTETRTDTPIRTGTATPTTRAPSAFSGTTAATAATIPGCTVCTEAFTDPGIGDTTITVTAATTAVSAALAD